MKFSVAIVAAAALLATTSQGLPLGGRMVLSPKPNSCGAWIDVCRSHPHNQILYEGWVLGYLSGVNFHSTSKDFLRNVVVQSISAWFDNYCSTHPLDDLVTAADALVIELRDRAGE
jgi:hypothetical protein